MDPSATKRGARLGPYELVESLGAGGMGEVYRARDTRLGREVAVKVLPDAVANDPERLKRFEREARATAALNHPNVLTLLDVGEADGRAYVVFELLEGETLGDRLLRGPLPLGSALECAGQVARGLSAAHAKGIVHRDLKPDNVFLGATGVVKVLDFGLARMGARAGEDARETTATDDTGPGVRLGTVAYMSPEQAKGLPADERSDIFSLGTLLFEMVSGRHPFRRESAAETVTAILRDDPPRLAAVEGTFPPAVQRVLRRCLEKLPEDRFQSTHDLRLALEALAGEDTTGGTTETDIRPYPGLSSFTEVHAAHFFGREGEVDALWEKIRRQNLLGLIGPSGVGKTSFLRAGVVPHRPSGWAAVVCTPGARPFVALAQALTPELEPQEIAELIRWVSDLGEGEEPDRMVSAISRWRRRHAEVLLVVDQFEELFTLNPTEVQARFVHLLGRLAEESGLRVVLALRDDFLMRCGEHVALAPIFRDVTPLLSPSPEGLERALREPAARQGIRFEDETLVEEMTAAVSVERSALPLLAFAMSRLWEERDRGRRLLTRAAYERIGGMAGALAQHAEATLQRLETGREPTVRELFRNLVTGEGTRVSRGRAELLSVFGRGRAEAERVLDALVAARLLTAYDGPEQFDAVAVSDTAVRGRQRIEIVHESLLTHWPRLVRWQTQDADGAQLRDQLRQAARLWDERGRKPDQLWTGASYLDYRAWRSRYLGHLSSVEEAFVRAMAGLANRRVRRRRIAVAVVGTAMALGLGVLATFWSRSESARKKADAEALRAEASKLLALGQAAQERHPTAALAYAIKSLELADTQEARRFALRVLQSAPSAFLLPPMPAGGGHHPAFSLHGEWLALSGYEAIQLHGSDGRKPIVVADDFASTGWIGVGAEFAPEGDVLVGGGIGDLRIWSVPEGRELRRMKLRAGDDQWTFVRRDQFFVLTTSGGKELVERGSIREGAARLVGSMVALPIKDIDRAGARLAYSLGRNVHIRSLDDWASAPQLVGTHPAEVIAVAFHPDGGQLAASDKSGEIRLWPTTGRAEAPLRVLHAKGTRNLRYSPGGRWLGAFGDVAGFLARLWDLRAPPGAEPLLLRSDSPALNGFAFDPGERWLATGPPAALWPLGETYPRSLEKHEEWVNDVAFSQDGSRLLSVSGDGTLRAWPMSPDRSDSERVLVNTPMQYARIAVDPRGERVAVSAAGGRVLVVSLSGRVTRELEGFSERAMVVPVVFSPSGRYLAAATRQGPATEKVIRVWDLEGGTARVLGPFPGAEEGEKGGIPALSFLDDDRLLACSPESGFMLLDLRDGSRKQLSSRPSWAVAVGRRKGIVLAMLGEPPELVRLDLEGRVTPVTSCRGCSAIALDPSESVFAAGNWDSSVRVGPVSGGEPHLLFGHKSRVYSVAFSPDGRWIASGGDDNTVRLWPVPDVTRMPFHRRSHQEVVATLRSWTNLRVVSDAQSSTGWKLEPGAFPGWAKVPTW